MAKNKIIYFEQEDLEKLKELYWELSVSNVLIPGNMGANNITPWDCLNTLTSTSLSGRRIHLENILEKQGRISKWKMDAARKSARKLLEIQIEFLDLAEGFAVYKEQIKSLDIAELLLLAEKEKVQNTGLTRKQKLKRIDEQLAIVEQEKDKIAAG